MSVSSGGLSALSCTSSAFCYGLTSVGIDGFTLTGSSIGTTLATSGSPSLLSCAVGPVCVEVDFAGESLRAS